MIAFIRVTSEFTREEIEKKYAAGENLFRADLREAKYDKNTIFRKDFDPKAAGMVLKE